MTCAQKIYPQDARNRRSTSECYSSALLEFSSRCETWTKGLGCGKWEVVFRLPLSAVSWQRSDICILRHEWLHCHVFSICLLQWLSLRLALSNNASRPKSDAIDLGPRMFPLGPAAGVKLAARSEEQRTRLPFPRNSFFGGSQSSPSDVSVSADSGGRHSKS